MKLSDVDIWEHEGTWYMGFPNSLAVTFTRRENIEWVAQLYIGIASARAIMQKFVDKVDSGRARSTETYAEMKAWMEE